MRHLDSRAACSIGMVLLLLHLQACCPCCRGGLLKVSFLDQTLVPMRDQVRQVVQHGTQMNEVHFMPVLLVQLLQLLPSAAGSDLAGEEGGGLLLGIKPSWMRSSIGRRLAAAAAASSSCVK